MAAVVNAPAGVPCVVFAVRRESLFFRRARRPWRRLGGAPCPAWLVGPAGGPLLALEAGVGAARVTSALRWALANTPAFVLAAGFSGALRPGLSVGDLLLAAEGVDPDGRPWRATWPARTPAGLARARLITSPALVGDPAHKRRLAERLGADAVDMETSAAAAACGEGGVPFGSLRVISDDAGTALSPALLEVLAGGRVSARRLLLALARRPTLGWELARLARDTRRAARELSRGLEVVLRGRG